MARRTVTDDDADWVFGYGSLIFRPAFDHAEARPAYLPGFVRRFYQGSTDHRGVPGRPGRVVTLVPAPAERCFGMAFRLPSDGRADILASLDHREKGGYERLVTDVVDRGGVPLRCLVYRGTEQNPSYLGPAPIDEMAAQIHGSVGPSGPNIEYLLRLAEALESLGELDDHVATLRAAVERLEPSC